MEMINNHARYSQISLGNNRGYCPDRPKKSLGIIVFKSDKRLRSHTVKHLANLKEFEKTWKNIISVDKKFILKSTAKLRGIGCPYYDIKMDSPPCSKCRKFDLCTDFISELDNHYVNLVLQIIKQATAVPRFADYFSKLEKYKVLVLIPDLPVIITAASLKKGIYNVTTCYSSTGRHFTQIRDNQVGRMRREARENSIIWCNKNTWGFKAFTHKKIDKNRSQNMENSSQISRYFHSGEGKSWRQFLNENNIR